jgi:hypothetical protein
LLDQLVDLLSMNCQHGYWVARGRAGRYSLSVTRPGRTTYKAVVAARTGNISTSSARVIERR